MELQAEYSTKHILQLMILAELGYEQPRYGYWNWSTTKPSFWNCHVCGKIVRGTDSSTIISHLWNNHNISPVQVGYTWAGIVGGNDE